MPSQKPIANEAPMTANEESSFTNVDDSALISRRRAMRAALEKLPPFSEAHQRLSAWYDISTLEIDQRARQAWTQSTPPGGPVNATARVMLLAVEVLLIDPEALGNDALEGDLYILREQLTNAASDD
jgi:hypothetical protein